MKQTKQQLERRIKDLTKICEKIRLDKKEKLDTLARVEYLLNNPENHPRLKEYLEIIETNESMTAAFKIALRSSAIVIKEQFNNNKT